MRGSGAVVSVTVAGFPGAVITAAQVHQPALSDGELGFVDKVYQGTLPRD